MYDALRLCLDIAQDRSCILQKLNLSHQPYFLATIHRAENTDNPARLKELLLALVDISKIAPVVLPLHPRTRKHLPRALFNDIRKKFQLIVPVGYFDMLMLEKNSRIILTDSGGVQKEAFLLGVPCITLRNETEWVETTKKGWNILADVSRQRIQQAVKRFSACHPHTDQDAPFGDAQAAERILKLLQK